MMESLDPGQLKVLRVRTGIAALVLASPVLVADLSWLRGMPMPLGAASAAAALFVMLAVALLPRRRYRSWAYRMDEDELHVRHGLWKQVATVVPFGRVQHIDVVQGPLERVFGVATLILHTAGTRTSAVALPGLRFDDAVEMREVVRAKIRQDLI